MTGNCEYSNPRQNLDILTLICGGMQGFLFFGQFEWYLPGFFADVLIWSYILDLDWS